MKHSSPPMKSLQRHLAYAAIGPTTLRGMFERKGCRKLICDYLASVNIGNLQRGEIKVWLDRWTSELEAKTGSWGPSRKSLNLFLRDAAYNYWFRMAHRLHNVEGDLELPLDGIVMRVLRDRIPHLPQAPSVKQLTQSTNDEFQRAALQLANEAGTARIHLDLEFWNGGTAGARGSAQE